MKTAKEMFEELGYEYSYDDTSDLMIYKKEGFITIHTIYFDKFDINFQSVGNPIKNKHHSFSHNVDKEVFTVIHQQMKELGWLDEVVK